MSTAGRPFDTRKSTEAVIAGLAGAVAIVSAIALVLTLFLPWQRFCGGSHAFHECFSSPSGWHGLGALAGLLAVGVVGAEVGRRSASATEAKGARVTGGLAIGAAVAAGLAVVLTNEARHWPVQLAALVASAILAIAGVVLVTQDPLDPFSR